MHRPLAFPLSTRRQHVYHIRNGAPLRLDRTPRLSWLRLMKLWKETWNTTATLPALDAGNPWTFRGFYGEYTYRVSYGDRIYTGMVDFPKKNGPTQSVTVTLA